MFYVFASTAGLLIWRTLQARLINVLNAVYLTSIIIINLLQQGRDRMHSPFTYSRIDPNPILADASKRTYYPSIEPYRTGFLQVSDLHNLYWEESGNPGGQPILFLHGGPGMGTLPQNRNFFDPDHYRIILFDQRGAGKSIPFADLTQNTTWDLVEDIEKLRNFLKVEKWIVFGGSWGSTLALTYAECYPTKVKGLILRGIFLSRQKEIDWFYQCGANHLYPDAWEEFIRPIPKEEQNNLVKAYYKRLTSSDSNRRQEAALAWARWEGSVVKLQFDPKTLALFTAGVQSEAIACLECHYFINRSFFETDNLILNNINKIRHIPCVIVHGRYDIPCPVENAWDLHKLWPESVLEIIPDAGHSPGEPGILDALIRATDLFRKIG